MVLRIKNSLIVFLLLLIFFSSGVLEGFSDRTNPIYWLYKDGVGTSSRKLLVLDTVSDYDDAGPNPRHDPRKGKSSGGAKNP